MAQTFYPITPTEITAGSANEFVTMDASALAPANATGVILHIVNTAAAERNVGIRKNGSTDDRHPDQRRGNHCWAMIGVDASRYFEAYVESTTDIDIYVVGYTMAGVTFATNATEKSPDETGSWRTVDCSTEAPSAIGLIFEIENVSTAGGYQFGLKKNGSTDDRHYDNYFRSNIGAIIGCDASQIYEGYIEDTDLSFFLVGYITDGATFNTNATDVSLGSTGSFIDLTALPDVTPAPNMGFIEVAATTNPYNYGLRKDGSGEDIVLSTYYHPWGIVECASRIIEGEISDTSVDFFVVGYSTEVGITETSKTAAISIGIAMSATRVLAAPRTAAISIGDAVTATRTVAWSRTASITIGEAITAFRGFAKTASITIGSAMTASYSWGRAKVAAITIGTAMSATRAVTWARTASIPTGISMSATRLLGAIRTAPITTGIAMTATRTVAWIRTSAIPTGIAMTATRAVAWARSSALTIGDAVNATKILAAQRTSSITTGIAVTAVRVYGRVRTATLTIGNAITASRIVAWGRTASITIGNAISATKVLAATRTASITTGIAVTATKILAAVRTAAITIGIAITVDWWTRVVALTLKVRSLALTLQSRVFALTLPIKSMALTLQHRVTALTLRVRSLALTLPWRKTR